MVMYDTQRDPHKSRGPTLPVNNIQRRLGTKFRQRFSLAATSSHTPLKGWTQYRILKILRYATS
eukprot:3302449-Amphidinium_carterae.1